MTKKQLVKQIAAALNLDQVLTRKMVQLALDTIIEVLMRGERIEFRNFGVFEVRRRAARKARNPKTNEEVLLPARNVVVFQPGKNVAARVARTAAPNEQSPDGQIQP